MPAAELRRADEPLGLLEIVTQERESEHRGVEGRAVAVHPQLACSLLELASRGLVAELGPRCRADEQRPRVADARSGEVLRDRLLGAGLERCDGLPRAGELLDLD